MIKKLFYLLFAIFFISCNESGDEIIETNSNNRLLVDKFTFEGHNYIKFKNNYNIDAGTGVVHDPECKKCFH